LRKGIAYFCIKTGKMNSKSALQGFVLTAFILLAAMSRVIPHMHNFSPLGAIALFGAAHFGRRWQALLVPIAATWLSDLVINNILYARYYPEFTWISPGFYWTYGSYALIAMAGWGLLRKITAGRVIGAAGVSSLIFFAVSNFGCWVGSTVYPQTAGGLLTCYVAGIPFIQGTVLGDLCYSVLLFGGYHALQNRWIILKPVEAAIPNS
jgi:hypothetical protein